jgi:hypothetical protein
LTPDERRRLYISEIYKLLVLEGPSNNLLTFDDLVELELEHLAISYALGVKVGIVRIQSVLVDQSKSLSNILERGELQISSIMQE